MRIVEGNCLLLALFTLLFAGQLVQILMNHCQKLPESDESLLTFSECTGWEVEQEEAQSSTAKRKAAEIEALTYDYSASIECLAEPLKAQYGGGIISNPEFDHGLRKWSAFGDGKIESRKSEGGNRFVVAHSRSGSHDSISQKIYMHKDKLYTLSAWLQVSEGNVAVSAVIKTKDDFIHAGSVIAKSGCWSMLKGGLTVDSSGNAEIYFESKNTTVEIWVDNVSLQPFSQKQWRAQQKQSIEQVRKSKVRFQAIDAEGNRLPGAKISISLKKSGFPLGSAIDKAILTNTRYKDWFVSRFNVATFENELKWYANENSPGKENYSDAEAMLNLAQQYGIAVRGHNIFWDDPNMQPFWVKSLSPNQLGRATARRINSVVSRYAGKLLHWDVVNENLHFSFFEDKLGKGFSGDMFNKAHHLDSKPTMFLNDYNTLEETGDGKATSTKYIQKVIEIRQQYNGPLGIGLESHFRTPNIPYVRATIDTLAATGVPVWLTELDVENTPQNQVKYLEEIMREAHSHPGVHGIVLWTAWHPQGCYRMCLTDNSFNNLPTGNVVDKLIREWKQRNLEGTTDSEGFFETVLFHGVYDVTITHPSTNVSFSQSFETKTSQGTTIYVQISE